MRASGTKDYITMARGLITEASVLAFPEGSTSDELNFTIGRDALVRKRRLGFDKLVSDFSVANVGAKLNNVEYWRGPSFVVVITTDSTPRTTLHLHAVDDNFTRIISIDIDTAVTDTQIAQTTNMLYITTDRGSNPVLCEYDSVAETIEISAVNIHIRDFELVDDGLGVDENPATLSDNHKYNLFNSTWYQEKPDLNASNARKNVSTAYFDTHANYPSNADVASVGIIDNGSGTIVFDANYVKDAEFGSSVAPRGHFVYDIANINRGARLVTPLSSGAPSNTLTPIGSINISGVPTFSPDETNPSPTDPIGGGGEDPYLPEDPPEFGEIP